MLDDPVRRNLIERYIAAPTPRDAGKVVAEYARQTGVDKSTIYRILINEGVKRKRISAGGRPRTTSVTTEQIEQIAVLIQQTKKRGGYIRIDYETAIAVAERQGVIPPGSLTVAQLKYYLEQEGLLKRDLLRPPPTIPRRSDYPNQLHQFDWSVCAQWDFGDKGKPLQFVHWSQASDPNKSIQRAKSRQYHLWRGLLVDHYTHAFYLEYFLIPGESAFATIQFLENAWFRHQNEALVFHGLPDRLVADRGPGNTSEMLKNVCRTFGITLIPHATGRPWAKGSVETGHGLIERKFESQLRFDPARDLADLNRRAQDFMIRFQTVNVLGRVSMPRYNFWSQNIADHLRVPPSRELLRAAAISKPETRKVSNFGAISVDGIQFILPPEFKRLAGKRVSVIRNPFQAPNLVVGYEDEYRLARPIRKDHAGFSRDARSVLDTRAALPDHAEAVRQAADAAEPRYAQMQRLTADAKQHVARTLAAQPGRHQLPVQQPPEVKFSRDDARARVISAVPGITAEMKQSLAAEIDGAITMQQIRDLVERYKGLIADVLPKTNLSAG